jgi:hypothetical protein
MSIPNQPQLPPEEEFYPLEELFISESPPNLWPVNQNSNFGSVRRVFVGELQKGINILTELFNERFVDTANGYLSRYERDLGLPINPPLSVGLRRRRIIRRMRVGPFTRTWRRQIVEGALQEVVSLGAATQLTSLGVPLVAGGVTLYNEPLTGDLTSYYTISENISAFSYQVWVDPAVQIDQEALDRELTHFTPAGISFTIDRAAISPYAVPGPTTYPSSTTYP